MWKKCWRQFLTINKQYLECLHCGKNVNTDRSVNTSKHLIVNIDAC